MGFERDEIQTSPNRCRRMKKNPKDVIMSGVGVICFHRSADKKSKAISGALDNHVLIDLNTAVFHTIDVSIVCSAMLGPLIQASSN